MQARIPSYRRLQKLFGQELEKKEVQFRKTLAHGMRELEKMGDNIDAFMLFTTYGFPVELTEEIAKRRESHLTWIA